MIHNPLLAQHKVLTADLRFPPLEDIENQSSFKEVVVDWLARVGMPTLWVPTFPKSIEEYTEIHKYFENMLKEDIIWMVPILKEKTSERLCSLLFSLCTDDQEFSLPHPIGLFAMGHIVHWGLILIKFHNADLDARHRLMLRYIAVQFSSRGNFQNFGFRLAALHFFTAKYRWNKNPSFLLKMLSRCGQSLLHEMLFHYFENTRFNQGCYFFLSQHFAEILTVSHEEMREGLYEVLRIFFLKYPSSFINFSQCMVNIYLRDQDFMNLYKKMLIRLSSMSASLEQYKWADKLDVLIKSKKMNGKYLDASEEMAFKVNVDKEILSTFPTEVYLWDALSMCV